MSKIELAKKYEDYMIEMRRYFHENPEVSNKEHNTMKKILHELENMGINAFEIKKAGVLAKISGERQGKTVLLRADCDALPINENEFNLSRKRECISRADGIMHACGHDGHMAVMLGAAQMLKDIKNEINGTVYIFFERGEEIIYNYEFFFEYLEKEKIKIDTSFAFHTFADLRSGLIGISDSEMMAGTIGFDVTINGKGGHGSRPDQSINPIDAFVAIYQGMQSMRLTSVDPYKTLTYSVGLLEGGSIGNVIPQKVRFAGTIRCFDRAVSKKFRADLKHFIAKTCEAYNCTVTYQNCSLQSFPVINNKECAKLARDVINAEFGEMIASEIQPWLASESYSLYTALFPSVFAFLGIRNEEKGVGAAHHNERFDLDESAFIVGAASAVAYVVEFLKSDLVPKFTPFEGGYKNFLRELQLQNFEIED